MFRQLAKCGRRLLSSQNGKELWLVIMGECNEAELEYELNQSSLDKAKLDSSQVSAAITKSFRIKPTDFHILSDHLGRSFANLGLEVSDEVFVPKSRRQDIAREFFNTICLSSPTFYQVQFNQPRYRFDTDIYGFDMVYVRGRAIVKNPWESGTKVGAIVVAINSHVLKREPFSEIRRRMSNAQQSSASVVLTFIEDSEFTELFTKEILPRMEKSKQLASRKDIDH